MSTSNYEELLDSPTEEGTVTRFTAKMQLLCDWDDRYSLMGDFLAGTIGGGPIAYPHKPTIGAYAQKASALGFGNPLNDTTIGAAGQTLLRYAKAKVTIEFGTYTGGPEQNGAELISEGLDPWIENLPLAVSGADGSPLFRWSDPSTGDPLTPEEAPVRQMRGCIYNLTKYNIASIPAAAFNLLGKVNASAVTAVLIGKTFEAQTLLHTPPKLARTTTAGGGVGLWAVTYAENYRPNFDPASGAALGWNYFWRSKTGQYEQIYNVGTAAVQLVYPTGNFALL